MTNTEQQRTTVRTKMLFLIAAALQLGCGAVFISDIIIEWRRMSAHTWIEGLAVLALAVGGLVSLHEYRRVVLRNQRVERELTAASGAFQEVIEQHFSAWGLSDAEKDVAILSIKGASMSQIAQMRSTKDGTIKAQSAAIYRKAGVSSRAELISVVIEEMISGLNVIPRVP